MIQSKISSTLYELIKTINDKKQIFKEIKSDEAFNRKELYIKSSAVIKEYKQGITNLTTSSEYFEKEDIFWTNFKKYYDRLSVDFHVLSEALSEIENEFSLDDNQTTRALASLFYFLLFKNDSPLTDKRITEIVSIFINDLSQSSHAWKIKLLINGIWLSSKQIKISKEILIRRPINSDFDMIQPSYSLIYSPLSIDMCSAVIEIEKKFSDSNQIDEFVNNLKLSLRLYNLGAVQITKKEYKPNAIYILEYGTVNLKADNHSSFKYEVTESDSDKLREFLGFLMGFMPNRNWQSEINDLSSVYISIERYNEALTSVLPMEYRITTTITSLEALLLKGNERSELSHKLSQRVSYLSSYFNAAPIKVYNTMKRAYEIRSTYIHGSMLPIEEKKDLAEILGQILSFLRRALLIFIELSKDTKKDEIISKIDNSIIDKNAHKKFYQEIKNLKLLTLTSHNTRFNTVNEEEKV